MLIPDVVTNFLARHRKTHQKVEYPLATNQELLADDICAQLGHLSETANRDSVYWLDLTVRTVLHCGQI
jgi:hypothetical protein